MVEQHPAVVFLHAAHQRAEDLARAATPGPWTLDEGGYPEKIRGDRDRVEVVSGGAWGGEGSCFESTEDAVFIAANGPDTVLRRVEAERHILDEHQPIAGCGRLPYVPGRPFGDSYGTIDPACTSCGTDDEYAVPWPCATVLALAAAWGWEDQRHA